MAICLLTGCWEKIEYRGTFPASANSSATPAPIVSQPTAAEITNDRVSAPELSADTPQTQVSSTDAPPTNIPATDPPALAVSTTVESTSPLAAIGTKRAAWLLGSRFSLAALANDRGIVTEEVAKWSSEARSMAELLNVSLAELPERWVAPPSVSPSREVLGHILNQEKAIGERLAADHSGEHDAIFRLATRTNLLRVLNTPGTKAVDALSTSITDLGPRSGLPLALWQPLLDVLNEGAASAAIPAAVSQMHERVEQHLAAEP